MLQASEETGKSPAKAATKGKPARKTTAGRGRGGGQGRGRGGRGRGKKVTHPFMFTDKQQLYTAGLTMHILCIWIIFVLHHQRCVT